VKLFENVYVKDRLLPLKDVRLFADFGGKWDLQGLSEAEKAALIAEAETLREVPVPPLPASLYRQFGRVGNREWYETPYFERRRTMILLAYAEAIQKAIDALVPKDAAEPAEYRRVDEAIARVPADTSIYGLHLKD